MSELYTPYGLNRYLCTVLDNIKNTYCPLLKGLNQSRQAELLESLIEEGRTMGERMESALEDASDIRDLQKKRSEGKAEVKKLKAEIKKLKAKKEALDGGNEG